MKKGLLFIFMLMVFLLASCSSKTGVQKLSKEFSSYPEYSIVLEDMKEDGNFFKDYYHRYKIVYGEKSGVGDSLVYQSMITDWEMVDKKEFEKYYGNLGMVLASKGKDGNVSNSAYPPGYQYVGNARYGQWRTDSGGNSFWEFYGKYAFFSSMFNMFGRPVYRNDWNDYRGHRSSGRPYYGQGNAYGTNGQRTKATNKTFFNRQQQKAAASKARFSEKVRKRAQRSKMSGTRRRSSGSGK